MTLFKGIVKREKYTQKAWILECLDLKEVYSLVHSRAHSLKIESTQNKSLPHVWALAKFHSNRRYTIILMRD